MMSSTNTGGAAFPDPGRAQSAKQRESLTDTGMTLRDYFAAKAMQAYIAADTQQDDADVALNAYCLADTMLAERAK
jgi:hypothetical protein